jgi:hypothetical protein
MKVKRRKHKPAHPQPVFTVLGERDANDHQIIVIKNERFYYVNEGKAGKGERADHVWASKTQLIVRGPDYRYADFVPAAIQTLGSKP